MAARFVRFAMVTWVAMFAFDCVEVPNSVRADFAQPKESERSNFRKGQHGSAPPVESAPDAGTTVTDGGTS